MINYLPRYLLSITKNIQVNHFYFFHFHSHLHFYTISYNQQPPSLLSPLSPSFLSHLRPFLLFFSYNTEIINQPHGDRSRRIPKLLLLPFKKERLERSSIHTSVLHLSILQSQLNSLSSLLSSHHHHHRHHVRPRSVIETRRQEASRASLSLAF